MNFNIEWLPVADIKYYESSDSSEPLDISTYTAKSVNEESFTVTPAPGLANTEGRSFLAWKVNDNVYALSGDTLTYTWDEVVTNGYAVNLYATWFNPTYTANQQTITDVEASVLPVGTTVAEGYMIKAPETPSKETLGNYLFNGWSVRIGNNEYEDVSAGSILQNGAEVEVFQFNGDVNASFDANLVEPEQANVTFALAGGSHTVDGEELTDNIYEEVYQSELSQTHYSVAMPTWSPTRNGYQFDSWQYEYVRETGEKETYTFEPGDNTKDQDLTFEFNNDHIGPTFTATWVPAATIKYPDPSGIPMIARTPDGKLNLANP